MLNHHGQLQPHHGAHHRKDKTISNTHIQRMREHPDRNAARAVTEELAALQQRHLEHQQQNNTQENN